MAQTLQFEYAILILQDVLEKSQFFSSDTAHTSGHLKAFLIIEISGCSGKRCRFITASLQI